MCPGGYIVPSATDARQVVVNGMSPSMRNGRKANSGIVVSLEPQDLPPQYERYGVMGLLQFFRDIECRAWEAGGENPDSARCRMTDFCQKRISSSLPDTTYLPGIVPADLDQVLGPFIAPRLREGLQAFGRKMRGFYTEEATLIGWKRALPLPLRIPRDPATLAHPQGIRSVPFGRRGGLRRRHRLGGGRWAKLRLGGYRILEKSLIDRGAFFFPDFLTKKTPSALSRHGASVCGGLPENTERFLSKEFVGTYF